MCNVTSLVKVYRVHVIVEVNFWHCMIMCLLQSLSCCFLIIYYIGEGSSGGGGGVLLVIYDRS